MRLHGSSRLVFVPRDLLPIGWLYCLYSPPTTGSVSNWFLIGNGQKKNGRQTNRRWQTAIIRFPPLSSPPPVCVRSVRVHPAAACVCLARSPKRSPPCRRVSWLTLAPVGAVEQGCSVSTLVSFPRRCPATLLRPWPCIHSCLAGFGTHLIGKPSLNPLRCSAFSMQRTNATLRLELGARFFFLSFFYGPFPRFPSSAPPPLSQHTTTPPVHLFQVAG